MPPGMLIFRVVAQSFTKGLDFRCRRPGTRQDDIPPGPLIDLEIFFRDGIKSSYQQDIVVPLIKKTGNLVSQFDGPQLDRFGRFGVEFRNTVLNGLLADSFRCSQVSRSHFFSSESSKRAGFVQVPAGNVAQNEQRNAGYDQEGNQQFSQDTHKIPHHGDSLDTIGLPGRIPKTCLPLVPKLEFGNQRRTGKANIEYPTRNVE